MKLQPVELATASLVERADNEPNHLMRGATTHRPSHEHPIVDYRVYASGSVPCQRNARLKPSRQEVELLKELVWRYAIARPLLRTQQAGQECIIRDLFEVFLDAIVSDDLTVLPLSLRESLDAGTDPRRASADLIAGLTENQCIALWRRLAGITLGSVFDYPTV